VSLGAPEDAGGMRCPRCGAAVRPDQDWCLECGAAARTRLAPTPNWRLPAALLSTVAVLAVGTLAGAFVALTDDASGQLGSPAPAPPPYAEEPAGTPAPAPAPAPAPEGSGGGAGATGGAGGAGATDTGGAGAEDTGGAPGTAP